jgi:rSAM/selenodomain-associated transferase 2
MSSCVSFIIPVLNEADNVVPLLHDLRQRYPHSELIVVDGGSVDCTTALAQPWCDQLLHCEPGRAVQMNLGAQHARSPYLFFLHADCQPGVSAATLAASLATAPAWGFCRVRLTGSHPCFRVIEWCMNQRSRLTRIATGDQMLFVRRSLFMAAGGFEAIPLMEDVAWCKRLRRLARPLILPDPVLTSTRRWEAGGIAATVVRMWALRLAYRLGVAPDTLWRHYYGQ